MLAPNHLSQFATKAVESQLIQKINSKVQRYFSSSALSASQNSTKLSAVTFCRSEHSIDFYLLSSDDKEWNDPNIKFILSNSRYPSQNVHRLDISKGLKIPVVEQIEKHYSIEDSKHFVGGMGENDKGVWISSKSSLDTLDYWEDIRGE
jgi:hypothetical protein